MSDLLYNKTNWKDDESTPINARNLNNIENGIEYIYKKWDKIIQDSTTGDHAAELIDARYGPYDSEQHPTLGHRLNHMDNKFIDVNSQLEHNTTYLGHIVTYNLELIPNDRNSSKYNTDKINEIINLTDSNNINIINISEGVFYFEPFNMKPNITLQGVDMDKTQLILNYKDRYWNAIVMADNCKMLNLTVKDDIENPHFPSTVGTSHGDNPQALIQCGGVNNVLDNCKIHNSSTWAIYLDSSGAFFRDKITINNCHIIWEKRSYYDEPFDVSQVYVHCKNFKFTNNIFETKSPAFSRTAFDVRGFNATIRNNKIYNYRQPCLFGSPSIDLGDNESYLNIIEDNVFTGCCIGIMLYSYGNKNHDFENCFIRNNVIKIQTIHSEFSWNLKSGVLSSGICFSNLENGIFNNINIENNIIEYVGEVPDNITKNLFNGVSISSNNIKISNVIVEKNIIKNFKTIPVVIGVSGDIEDNFVKNIYIKNNKFIDNMCEIDRSYSYFSNTDILIYDRKIENVFIEDNYFLSESDKHNLFWISTSLFNDSKNLFLGDNYHNKKQGTNITRKKYKYLEDCGYPYYFDVSNNFNFKDFKTINNYLGANLSLFKNDILIKEDGLYRVQVAGTITDKDINCTVTEITGVRSFKVDDASLLEAGMYINGTGLGSNYIEGVVENEVFIGTNKTKDELLGTSIYIDPPKLTKL